MTKPKIMGSMTNQQIHFSNNSISFVNQVYKFNFYRNEFTSLVKFVTAGIYI